jgi:hypothetical protein
MSNKEQARSYYFQGMRFEFSCSNAMASYLDGRFRMLPINGQYTETICFEFQAVADASQHAVRRPQGKGRPFYELAQGEASYFEERDEVYLSFGEGVRALCSPASDCVRFSSVESDPKNLFMASHLLLTILLVEILKRRGWYSLHAAGFSDRGRAILIPGTSGAGKSTLSVALLRAGFDYLSDDMVFVRRFSDGLRVRGLAEDVDVSDQTIGFFSELDFLLRSPKVREFPKRQLRVKDVYGVETVAEARPKAIILPRISGRESSVITPVGRDEALLEIVPNVLLTEARTCQAHLGLLAELVKATACYRLDTGQDFSRIPILFRELLSSEREEVCA